MESREPAPPRRHGFADIPRKVRWLVYAGSLSGVGFGYLLVFIGAYLPQIGVSAADVGLLFGVEGVSMVLAAIPLGTYSDRRGRKVLLIVGSAVLPPSILVFAFTTDIRWMLLASVVTGISEGCVLTSWNAIIADQTTTEQRSHAFSLSFILGNVTTGVGLALPFALPYVSGVTGIDLHTLHYETLIVTDAFGFLAAPSVYLLLRGYQETIRVREARPKGMDWKPLLKFSGLNGLIGLGAGFFVPLVALWLLKKFAIEDAISGPVLALANLTIGLAAVASPPLAKRYGPVQAIVLVQGIATVMLLSIAFWQTAVLAAGFYIVRAALMNMSSPISDSFLMGIVAPEQRGLASAVNSIVWRLPNSVTTIAGGILIGMDLLDVPIFLATAFYAVSVTGFYVVFRNVRPTA